MSSHETTWILHETAQDEKAIAFVRYMRARVCRGKLEEIRARLTAKAERLLDELIATSFLLEENAGELIDVIAVVGTFEPFAHQHLENVLAGFAAEDQLRAHLADRQQARRAA